MFEILIRSIIPEDERPAATGLVAEWTETITAKSKSAASRLANKWLSKNLFKDDYSNINKWQLNEKCQVWDLV